MFVTDDVPGWKRPSAGPSLGGVAEVAVHKVRNILAKVRKGDTAGVLGDLRRVYTAENLEEARAKWAEFKQRWEGSTLRWSHVGRKIWAPFLCFPWYRWRSAHILGAQSFSRFIREVRRGTKVRNHRFPSPKAVEKLLHVGCERQEDKWGSRLRGFM